MNRSNSNPLKADSAPRGDGSRILMVDDHEDTSAAMKRLLEKMGYKVKLANTMATALREADADCFDLLISDIGLPDGSGLELIKTLMDKRPIKGIALSGFGLQEDVERSKEAGFVEHFTKPVNFEKLEQTIRELCKRD